MRQLQSPLTRIVFCLVVITVTAGTYNVMAQDEIELRNLANQDNEWDWQTSTNWQFRIYNNYMIRNNIWGETAWTGEGVGEQTIFANSERDWKIVASHTNGTGNAEGQVKAYPQVVRGWVQGGIGLHYPGGERSPFVTADHGLNQRIDDLDTLLLYHDLELPRQGRYMVLYDTYFFETERPQLPYGDNKPDMAVMIFTSFWDDTGWLYGSTNPRITIGDREWRYRRRTGSRIVRPGGVVYLLSPYVEGHPPYPRGAFLNEDLLLDFREILHYLRDNKDLDGSLRVSSIQLGVEIIDGGTYRINDFWTKIDGDAEPGDNDNGNDLETIIWDFEDQDLDVWNFRTDADWNYSTVGEITDERAYEGTYSIRMSVGDDADNASFYNDITNVASGDIISYRVWIEEDQFDEFRHLEVFLQYNNWSGWTAEVFRPEDLVSGEWNTLSLVAPDGIDNMQRIGIRIDGEDPEATATIYIDYITIEQSPVSIEEATALPNHFTLHQNYPNPFNPSTIISYEVPEATHVRIAVYNILGQHVSTLIDREHAAGLHTVGFDASHLTSGIFLYEMQTGIFNETRKMMLVR
ncbi:MAG: T9SS C-terminal target domain-containing protein [Balneolaceae bacterium]|nr:MAG: T9SS C-terminal target domain-containing protein [Balneolaceae bacterium]